MLLNCLIYPNYVSAFYLCYALLMMSMAMANIPRTIKTKFSVSIAVFIISIIVLIGKSVKIFFMMRDKVVATLTDADILYYGDFGLYIIKEK